MKFNKFLLFSTIVIFGLSLLPKISWAFDYVMGTTNYGEPTNPQPAQWESYVDPITGVTVRRITDIAKDIPGARHAHIQYVRRTPVSSDGRYLLIYVEGGSGSNPYYIVDLQTRTIKVAPHITGQPYANNAGFDAQPEYRWDLSGDHPTWIYYRDGMKFYRGDVNYPPGQPNHPDYNILLHDFKKEFPTGVIAFNDDEGDSSRDSRYWAFMIFPPWTETNWRPLAFIVYDKDTDKIVGTYLNPNDRPNFIDMAPSGDRVYIAGSWKLIGGTSFNRDFTDPKQLVPEHAHSGWAYDKNGNEGLVQINSAGTNDWLKFSNVKTGEYFTVISQQSLGWGSHHFGRVYQPHQKGWIFLDIYYTPSPSWCSNQVLAIEAVPANQNPRIWRVVYTQNRYIDYNSNSMPSLSFDGKKIYWASNWRGTDNMEIYEATLPNNWWIDLASPTSPDTVPPSTPTNLTATPISSSQINLSWSASTDNVGVTGYFLERCQNSTCTVFTQIASPSGTTYSDTGLSPNTTYRYRVRARDGAGNLSNYSNIASATTLVPVDTTPPAPPTGLRVE